MNIHKKDMLTYETYPQRLPSLCMSFWRLQKNTWLRVRYFSMDLILAFRYVLDNSIKIRLDNRGPIPIWHFHLQDQKLQSIQWMVSMNKQCRHEEGTAFQVKQIISEIQYDAHNYLNLRIQGNVYSSKQKVTIGHLSNIEYYIMCE